MFLGTSIIGWSLLALVYVPVTIAMAAWIGKRWRTQRHSIVVVGVVLFTSLAAMVIEAAVVDWRFRALCEDVQLKITRRVVVEGFYDDGDFRSSGQAGGYDSSTLDRYDFIEWRDSKGSIWRTERAEAAALTPAPRPLQPLRRIWLTDQGKEAALRHVQIDRPSARYHWRHQQFPTPIGHLLARNDEFVIDSQTGDVLGSRSAGYRWPPFVDALWLRFFDSPPAMCPIAGSLRAEVLIGIHDTRSK